MKTILIAGASGYLGNYLVKELQSKNMHFKALARNPSTLTHLGLDEEQKLIAQVTQPSTLKGILHGIDIVISSIGITRQKDGLEYMQVDYQANKNLLEEAKRAGVKKFVYVSLMNGDKMRSLKIVEAKERFVDTVKTSGLDYTIIRPNGFFSDMKDFLAMAQRGRVYLFGRGAFKLNPIHGMDLAKFIIENLEGSHKELSLGGPDILTHTEIAELAFKAGQKKVKITCLPSWIQQLALYLLRNLTSVKVYGPYEFFLSMMMQDNIAPRQGVNRLSTFFREELDRLDASS